jgi:hypothetical protein
MSSKTLSSITSKFIGTKFMPIVVVLILSLSFSQTVMLETVFTAGSVIDGAIELSFSSWELDAFGDRSIIPYHVRLSLEGVPQHAWNQETADKILGDEALIHFVEEGTRKKLDLHTFQCWAFSKDPSRIPQAVFLSLTEHDTDQGREAQIHFNRPRGPRKLMCSGS